MYHRHSERVEGDDHVIEENRTQAANRNTSSEARTRDRNRKRRLATGRQAEEALYGNADLVRTVERWQLNGDEGHQRLCSNLGERRKKGQPRL